MHRFLTQEALVAGAEVTLDKEQSHHLAKVLRMPAGAVVGLINGKGTIAEATVITAKSSATVVRIQLVIKAEISSRIRLCFGVSKGQALDFLFRRATELGLEGFQPLQTQHSSPIKGWNASRWEGVVAEVCKQCEELYFPQVEAPMGLEAWLEKRDTKRLLVLCDENARGEKIAAPQQGGVDLLVGAEGGFAREEVGMLQAKGAVLMGLGRNRLRAETASLVALTLLKKEIGEF